MIFELAWGTQERASAESLSITVQRARFANMEADRLDLSILCAATDDEIIPENEVVTVWLDDVVYFRGWATTTRFSYGEQGPLQTLSLLGPWAQIEDSVYWRNDPILNVNLPLPPSMAMSWAFLGDYFTDFMGAVCTFPDWATANFPANLYEETAQGLRNQSLAANLKTLIQTFPLSVVRFDYSTEPPTFTLVHHGDDVQTLEFDPDSVIDYDFAIQPRRPSVVSIRRLRAWRENFTEEFLTDTAIYRMGGFIKSNQIQDHPTGMAEGGPGVLTLCYFIPEIGAIDTVPAGAAQWVYNLLNTPIWSGSMTLKGWSAFRPGANVNITGCNAAMTTMGAAVQSVDIDFLGDTSTLSFGPSEAMTAETAIERMSGLLRGRFSWWPRVPLPTASIIYE